MRELGRLLALLLCASLSSALSSGAGPDHPAAPAAAAPRPAGAAVPDYTDAGRPALRLFTDSDGLPVNSVMALALDRRQYLWVGTQDGAAYYNGRRWTALRMPEGAPSNYVYDILAASDGTVWFATDGGGVYGWKEGAWVGRYDASAGLPSNATRALLETDGADGGRVLWVGTREGLGRLEGGRWTTFKKGSGLPDDRVRCLLETVSETGARTLWVGTYGGLARFEGGEWSVVDKSSGLPNDVVFSLLETAAPGGGRTLWVGTDGGLARLEGGRWTVFDKSSGLPVNGVRSLLETVAPDGARSLWVGTDNGGLTRFEGGRWTVFDTKSWMPSNFAWDLLQTGDGSLWVGTLAGGLVRLERANWTTFDTQTGLPNNLVFSLLETPTDSGGALWVGTYGGGLARLEGGRWTTFDERSGLPDTHVQCLLETVNPAGGRVLWAGTERGLARLEGGRWTVLGKKDGLPNEEVWGLLETAGANGGRVLWVATNGGLARLEGGRWTTFDEKSGLPGVRLRSLLETKSADGRSALWVGTYNNGLARFEDGRWTTFDKSTGLPNNRVLALHETADAEGRRTLWVATGGGGVGLLDLGAEGARWEAVSSAAYPSMLNDYVYRIAEDARGRIYLTTNKGVVRLTPRAAGGGPRFNAYTFTTEDGLPSNECVIGASHVDRRGRVWVGTIKGAAVFDPSKEAEDPAPKPLYVERTHVGGEARPLAHGASLAHDQNSLKFEFALLSHFREPATRYRTQMEGLEAQPTGWTESASREFNYLPDGRYVFKVWGRDYAGNTSGPVEVAFAVRPAPWRTWWAYALYALVIASLGALAAFAVHRYRLRRLLEVERVRTRIATDLHDDIGSSLSRIAILSEVLSQKMDNGDSQASKPLTMIADTSRELVLSMSDIVWSINPRRDHLRDLIQRMRRFASEVFTARNIEFDFRAPEAGGELKLDVDVRRQVFLIFKEGVNNIVRHSGCARAEIEFRSAGGRLVLRMCDDGRGFDPGQRGEGNGLGSMRARAESVGGTLEIISAGGAGTTVTLEVPVSHRALRRKRVRSLHT